MSVETRSEILSVLQKISSPACFFKIHDFAIYVSW